MVGPIFVMRGNKHIRDCHIPITRRDDDAALSPSKSEHDFVANLLIVLLGTRNAVKTTQHHKCAKLGIGKARDRYEYVTTITLPKEMDNSADGAEAVRPGQKRAPHLRRGHIRNQRHGPKYAFVKSVWIEPMFIHADAEWVSKRDRYNISL